MNIRSTLNLNRGKFAKLQRVGNVLKFSDDKIIHILISRLLSQYNNILQFGIQIKYQKRCEGNSWVKVHFNLDGPTYECLLDMRKIFKVSVSWLVAYSIDNYLDEIVETAGVGRRCCDSYPVLKYFYAINWIGGVKHLFFFWGKTEDIPIWPHRMVQKE